MITVRRPADDVIHEFVANQLCSPLSYSPPGLSAMPPPPGFSADVCRVAIGRGTRAFQVASDALRSWRHLKLSWIELYPSDPVMQEGTVVGIVARHLGLWSLNACRIVEVIADHSDGRRVGFAYGTLEGHVERGEERFVVELEPTTETVWYDIRAVSQPRALLARLASPISRGLQARFRADSSKAMGAAVQEGAAQE
jgi:uncharacterized protein (UPF0548 family)